MLVKESILKSQELISFWIKTLVFSLFCWIIPLVVLGISEMTSIVWLTIVSILVVMFTQIVLSIMEIIRTINLISILKNAEVELEDDKNNYIRNLRIALTAVLVLICLSILLPLFAALTHVAALIPISIIIAKFVFFYIYKNAKLHFKTKN